MLQLLVKESNSRCTFIVPVVTVWSILPMFQAWKRLATFWKLKFVLRFSRHFSTYLFWIFLGQKKLISAEPNSLYREKSINFAYKGLEILLLDLIFVTNIPKLYHGNKSLKIRPKKENKLEIKLKQFMLEKKAKLACCIGAWTPSPSEAT